MADIVATATAPVKETVRVVFKYPFIIGGIGLLIGLSMVAAAMDPAGTAARFWRVIPYFNKRLGLTGAPRASAS